MSTLRNPKLLDYYRSIGMIMSPPYGYRKGKYHGSLSLDGEESRLVKKIFRLKRQGYNNADIYRTIQKDGYPYSMQAMRTILRNKRVYQGYYRYKDEWHKGKHPRILPLQPMEIILGDDYDPNEVYEDDK